MAATARQTVHNSAALLDHLARLQRTRAQAALTPLGLRPRELVTLTLLRDQGSASQQALASTLGIDRTNLVGLLNGLETEGLILRERSPEDRRRHNVSLTDAGAERLTEAESALRSVEDEVFGALNVEQRETLYELLQTATSGHALDCAGALAEQDRDDDPDSC